LPPQNIATVPPLRFRDRRAVLIHHRFLYTITIVRAPSWFDVVSLHICSLETLPLRLHAAQYKKTKRLLWTCFWASSPDSLNHVIHPLPPSLSLFALFLSLSRLFMWTARGCPRSHPQLGRKGLPRRRCCVEASESRAWASSSARKSIATILEAIEWCGDPQGGASKLGLLIYFLEEAGLRNKQRNGQSLALEQSVYGE
jgi:hypothetical protein